MSKQIQWYPGHMSKTLRQFTEESKNIDLYFLLLDARAPKSSYVSTFDNFINKSKTIILFSKSDLVPKEELLFWQKYYKKDFFGCYLINNSNNKLTKKKIIDILSIYKFNKLIPKIAIIGIPNVGKSTLLNNLFLEKKVKVENRAGVTKSSSWYQFNKKYWIMDSPGILEPKFEDINQGINLALIGSIKYDILPLEQVVENFLTILKSKKNLTKHASFFLENYLEIKTKSKLSENDFFKKIIFDFQKGKFGNFILDYKE